MAACVALVYLETNSLRAAMAALFGILAINGFMVISKMRD